MSNALQINGHNVVLCVRREFLTLKKAIIRYELTFARINMPLRSDILEVTAEIIGT